MNTSTEAFAQLDNWKSKSTKLFMYWAISSASGWCVGVLMHTSSSELHFGIEGIDGKDFLFVVNVHSTYNPRFRFLDTRENWPFFAPQRERSEFGKVLEISLHVDQLGESKGKVLLAELFPDEAIEVLR
jgi:hypothetical protein